jgi:Ca-activated chloride channel family protein
MNFEHPYLLLLIVPVILIAILSMRRLPQSSSRRRFIVVAISLCFLIVALANPYWRFAPQPQIVKGIDLILVVDVSQSMFCEDGSPRRIDQAKNFIRGMLLRFAGSSAGLIYFAKDAQIGVPMTPDLPAIQVFLDSVTPQMTEQPGTESQGVPEALDELLGTGSIQLQKQKLVLLFSDGEFQDNPSSMAQSIRSRKTATLITFLCGSKKSPVPEYDLKENHPEAFSTPNPARLQNLASITGGSMYDLSKTSALAVENRLLNQARDIEIHGKPTPDYMPYPFIAAGLLLLAAHQIFPVLTQLFRRRHFRTVAASLLVASFTIGMAVKDPAAEFKEALKLASIGKHDEALKRLNALKQEGGSEEIEVATGNIYFAKDDLDQAMAHYRLALEKNPANHRARWNWEVALKRKRNPGPPPPQQKPPSGQAPREVPEQTKALMKYFDQLETEQMKQNNNKKKAVEEFVW